MPVSGRDPATNRLLLAGDDIGLTTLRQLPDLQVSPLATRNRPFRPFKRDLAGRKLKEKLTKVISPSQQVVDDHPVVRFHIEHPAAVHDRVLQLAVAVMLSIEQVMRLPCRPRVNLDMR